MHHIVTSSLPLRHFRKWLKISLKAIRHLQQRSPQNETLTSYRKLAEIFIIYNSADTLQQ